jgi:hypothetical protein
MIIDNTLLTESRIAAQGADRDQTGHAMLISTRSDETHHRVDHRPAVASACGDRSVCEDAGKSFLSPLFLEAVPQPADRLDGFAFRVASFARSLLIETIMLLSSTKLDSFHRS